MTALVRPDPQLIQRFLRGELSEAEHTAVEKYLLDGSEPLDADVLATEDGILGLLRSLEVSPSATPLPPLDELMGRLQELLPLATQEGSPHETLPSQPASSSNAGSSYPFLDPPREPDELGRLGEYRVLQQLGAGGMGIVFAALDPALRRRVALKVMNPEAALVPESRQRFLREAQAAAQLDHENVVPIYQVGEVRAGGGASVPFIAMPLLAGESLAARLRRDGALPLTDLLRTARETAQGSAAAHAAGLIHRDIKPDNLWLQLRPAEGSQPARTQVKVLDFGLARPLQDDVLLTRSGIVPGTPAYMSPEQVNGQALDARSDLFSLGAVIYQMATGRRPFAQASVTAVLRAVAEQEPPAPRELRPDLPPALGELIDRLLAKDPARRPQSAAEVVAALQAIESRSDELSGARPTVPLGSRVLRNPLPWSRRILLIAAGLLLAVGGLAAGGFWLASLSRPVAPTTTQQPVTTYQGSIDLTIWHTTLNKEVRKMRLTDLGALPMHPGDMFRITAEVQPAGYVYLFWIDTEGEVVPVYPWEPGKWGTRPAEEQPIDRLELPPRQTAGYTISGNQEGMETLVMLVRPDPLPDDEESLRRDLSGLPPQRPVTNPLASAWFENGRLVENDPLRRASFNVQDINDPTLRLQNLLVQKLQPRGRFTAAVSFARLAK